MLFRLGNRRILEGLRHLRCPANQFGRDVKKSRDLARFGPSCLVDSNKAACYHHSSSRNSQACHRSQTLDATFLCIHPCIRVSVLGATDVSMLSPTCMLAHQHLVRIDRRRWNVSTPRNVPNNTHPASENKQTQQALKRRLPRSQQLIAVF